MKLKKKVKKTIVIIVVILLLAALAFLILRKTLFKETVKEPQVLNKIDDYGYVLKDNKSKKYQKEFAELVKILKKDPVNEEEYASKIAEMFIIDFYSLSDKSAKTDVGGVDFVHPDILSNFLENAEDTLYKHVESNIYGNRNQSLPTIDSVNIESVEKISFTYGEETDENAYLVKATWTYKEEAFSDYQSKASMIFIHKDKKLYLAELG